MRSTVDSTLSQVEMCVKQSYKNKKDNQELFDKADINNQKILQQLEKVQDKTKNITSALDLMLQSLQIDFCLYEQDEKDRQNTQLYGISDEAQHKNPNTSSVLSIN